MLYHHARLIWGITNEFRLVESDGADVAQTTWLRLLQHIDRIENPERVGEWLAATARNECLRVLAAHRKIVLNQNEAEVPMVLPHTSIRPMYSFWLTSEPKRFVTPFPASPGDGNGCWRCSWPIHRLPTPRYPMNLDFPSAASAPLAEDAWPGYASYCRPQKPCSTAVWLPTRRATASLTGIGQSLVILSMLSLYEFRQRAGLTPLRFRDSLAQASEYRAR